MSTPSPQPAPGAPLRNALMLLAAANLVLVGYVFLEKSTPKEATLSAAEVATVQPLEVLLTETLAAYTAHDSAAFWGHFATAYVPADPKKAFDAIFERIYHKEFGEIGSRKLITAESTPDPDRGFLVYECASTLRPKMRVSANFTREAGALKLAQLRMEPAGQ